MRSIFVVILLFLGLKLSAQAQLQNLPVPALKHLAHNAADSVAVDASNTYLPISAANQANGYPMLNGSGKIIIDQLPDLSGDIVGFYDNTIVSKIRGIPTPSGTPANGQYLSYNSTTQEYVFTNAPSGGANSWSKTGDAGTNSATNFIGTTDAQPLVIKTNNFTFGTINSNNVANSLIFGPRSTSLGIGTSTSGNGGDLFIFAGNKGTGGTTGGGINFATGASDVTNAISFTTYQGNANTTPLQVIGNKVAVGNTNSTPTATLDVLGTVKIVDGNQGSGKVLTSDANGLASWQTPSGGGGGIPATEVYVWSSPTTTTFVVPASAKSIEMYVVGGGGGGGSGRRGAAGTVRCGGGGGGSGAVSIFSVPVSVLSSLTLTVTVGSGGTGGAAVTINDTNGNNGNAGDASSVGIGSNRLIRAGGGFGGSGGSATTGSAGGGATIGMFTGSGGGAASTTGGNGLTSTTSNSITGSGGGGGGGISSANVAGTAGAGGSSFFASVLSGQQSPDGSISSGGSGGLASITSNANDGNTPPTGGGGGGGGGAALNGFNSGAGGNGGSGYIRITVHY